MVIVILGVLGLLFGSFVNALVWRLHEQLTSKKKKKDKKLSIVHGRSMCPHCHHELAAKDLIPVLSWLLLKGRCRYCRKPISWQYPLGELATALLFVCSYLFWPLEWDAVGRVNFVVWLIVLVGFMALIIYDLRWMLLPNKLVYPLIGLALLLAGYNLAVIHTVSELYQLVLGVLIAGGLFFVLFQLSGGRWIGGGDVKLGALIGLLLADPYLAFLMLLTASLLGTVVALPALVSGKLKATSRIPFGPFLIIATILVQLFGASVIEWYKRSLEIGI